MKIRNTIGFALIMILAAMLSSCSGTEPGFNIDAKIKGAYIVMGLLYGEGDMDKTILISIGEPA